MKQLGYTWYQRDWWTSELFFEWEDFPLVRYAYREVLDLLYLKKGSSKINRSVISSRFRIELSIEEYDMLKSAFEISDDGFWTTDKVKKRINKAETSRENGKLGGRPKKEENDQNQQKKLLEKKPNNPEKKPNEITQITHLIKEKEKEKEKEKLKVKEKEKNARAIDILKFEKQSELDVLWMQNKKQIPDKEKLVESFNDKMDLEIAQGKIKFDSMQLMPRFKSYVRQWVSNSIESKAKSNNTPEPNSWESGKLPRKN